MIECEGLTKTYNVREKPSFFSRGKERRIPALRDVSFSILAGEIVGILGPNGAGKTTLLKILSTLLLPDSGRVLVEGADVVQSPGLVRRKIGLVLPSERSLYWKLTAQENLQLFGGLYNLPPRKVRERSEILLELVGLSNFAHVQVEKFSTGMRKRLMIARAMLHEPRLLILDEPTSGLDIQGKYEVWILLRNLATQGVTLLLATHDMEEAESVPSRLLIIHQGKICADGSPADIKALSSHKGWIFVDLPSTFTEHDIKLPDGMLLHRIENIEGGCRVYISTAAPHTDMPRLLRLFPDATRVERQDISLADSFLAITGDRFEDDDVEEEDV